MKSKTSLTVYYDGLCKVCSKEINHYRKQKGADKIEFKDICSRDFDAAQEGLDPYLVHKVMHVKREDGAIITGVDSFIEIWKTLPRFQIFARLASNGLVRAGLEVGYQGFVKIRPFLPRYKNKEDCQDSPYCEVKNAEPSN